MKLNYSEIQELREMYFKATKHAFYQPVPAALSEFFIDLKLDKKWRDVTPRLNLIKKNIQRSNFLGTIVEIGANTGFQILDLAKAFPGNKFIAIESNFEHARFISKCATILDIENVEVLNSISSPKQISINWPGSILLDFNVVHHSGFDFGSNQSRNIEKWWDEDLPEWFNFENSFRDYWFSCGFRLGGQHNLELFDPFDTAGFAKKVMQVSGLKHSYDISVYSIESLDGELIYSEFMDSSFENLNLKISRSFRELFLKGEYFRRPILRFTQK